MSNLVKVTGGSDLGFIAVAAVRYAVGRRTYAAGLVTDWVVANRDALPKETLRLLRAETEDELERHDRGQRALGDACDVATWRRFAARLRDLLEVAP